jgi:hypothetical protein
MKQIVRGRSIVPHDYLFAWGSDSPKTVKSVARHRRGCAAMDISLRCKSARAWNTRLWLRGLGLTVLLVSHPRVVGLLQSRSPLGARRRACAAGACAGRNLVTETPINVVAVAVCLRDTGPVARLRHVGGSHAWALQSSPASDNGRHNSDRLWSVAISATRRHKRRSQREIQLALDGQSGRTTARPGC